MSTKRKNNPHARFFGLLAQMNGADKDELVWKYSNMLTTSLADFLEMQPTNYQRMINDMQRIVDQTPYEAKGRTALIVERELKQRRSAILIRLQKMGIDTTSWPAVNKFMRNPKIAGKTLGEMDSDEMDLLIPKLEAILAKDKVNQLRSLTKAVVFSHN